jgi:Tol biopolymer transport system component
MAMSVTQGPNDWDVWLFNFGRNVWSRLTTDRQSVNPLWTPDGRDVVYGSGRDGYPSVYRQAASPGSTASLLLSVPGAGSAWPSSWLGGGLFLTVSRGSFDVVLHEPAGPPLRAVVETNANEAGGFVSPDGRWAAYASDASGQSEIYVMTIAQPRSTVQVSRGGGVGPVWAKTGNNLYFRRGNQILATTVSVERGILQSSHEEVVATGAFSAAAMVEPRFDVMPDGSLIVMKDEPGPTPELRVIVNWASNVLRNRK